MGFPEIGPGVSRNSRSRSFPRMEASDSRSRISGTFFFIPFPFPNFGNAFFHSLPVPEFWEWIFSFPSRSRILGMEFSIPFPFPNFGNGIFYSRSRSQNLKSHSRSPMYSRRNTHTPSCHHLLELTVCDKSCLQLFFFATERKVVLSCSGELSAWRGSSGRTSVESVSALRHLLWSPASRT